MKIDVVPWRFFKKISYSHQEREILDRCRVISILDSDGPFGRSPFSPDMRLSPHLLTLRFDDYADSGLADSMGAELCGADDIRRMVKFVKDDGLPLYVHCAAGVSRSGAVGVAFDEHFNLRLGNEADHAYFLERNPGLNPNPLVLSLLREALEKTLADDL
ncbi:MAG: dual specificity protein phosphatase family protein [Victivallales bacterium]|nr:dual specificity protein phosphatase family protein [Victivallales bacterium]